MATASESFKEQIVSVTAPPKAETLGIHFLNDKEQTAERFAEDSTLDWKHKNPDNYEEVKADVKATEEDRDNANLLEVGCDGDSPASPSTDCESPEIIRKLRRKKSKRRQKKARKDSVKRREKDVEPNSASETSYQSSSSRASKERRRKNKKRNQEDGDLINFTRKRREAEKDDSSGSDSSSFHYPGYIKRKKWTKHKSKKRKEEKTEEDVIAITILEDDGTGSRRSDNESSESLREREVLLERRRSKSRKRNKKDKKDKRKKKVRKEKKRKNEPKPKDKKRLPEKDIKSGSGSDTDSAAPPRDPFFSTYPYSHPDGSSTCDSVFTDVGDNNTASMEMDYADEHFERYLDDLPFGFNVPTNATELNIVLKKHALNALQRRYEVIFNKNKFLVQLKEANSYARKYEKREQKLDDELTQMQEKTKTLKAKLQSQAETVAMLKDKIEKYRNGYCDNCYTRKEQLDRMTKGCWNLTIASPGKTSRRDLAQSVDLQIRVKADSDATETTPENEKAAYSSISTKTLLILQKQRLAILTEQKDQQAKNVYDEVQAHVSYDVFVMRKKMIDDAEGNKIERDAIRIYHKNMKLASRFARNKVKYRRVKMDYLKLQGQTLATAVELSSDVCKMRDHLYATKTSYKSMEHNFFDELVRNITHMPHSEGVRYNDKSIYYLRGLKLRQGMLYD